MKRSVQVLLVVLVLMAFAGVASAAPAAQEDEGVPYTVQPGDGLIKLARQFYGDGSVFQRIVDATNARAVVDDSYSPIADVNIIVVGQKIWIPGLSALPEAVEGMEDEADTGEAAGSGSETAVSAPEESTDIAATDDLAGTNWTMASLDGQPPVDGTTVSLNFTSSTEVAGNSGCNGIGGTYETDGFHIQFGPMIGTLMACLDEGVMEQEDAFRTALEDTVFYDVSPTGMLRLYDADSTMLVELAPASNTLDGTSWNVVNFNNGREAVVSVLADTELTAVFDGSQISGSAGCNSYFGSFSAADGEIEIGPLASTLKACPEEGVMEQEAEFLAALESAATYSIMGNRLEMRTADDALAVIMEAQ